MGSVFTFHSVWQCLHVQLPKVITPMTELPIYSFFAVCFFKVLAIGYYSFSYHHFTTGFPENRGSQYYPLLARIVQCHQLSVCCILRAGWGPGWMREVNNVFPLSHFMVPNGPNHIYTSSLAGITLIGWSRPGLGS